MRKRWLVPETIQTSAMDCGPAALKSVFEGLGVPVSYGRLREACQTGVDGTSIETIELAAAAMGLDCEQIMIPLDHLLEDTAGNLPALVVVKLPNEGTHFVVAWRKFGRWVQVMDPAVGRGWIPEAEFLARIYRHRMTVPAAGWREWAVSDDFLRVIRARLSRAWVPNGEVERAIDIACEDSGWHGPAALDAATRMILALRDKKAFDRAEGLLERLVSAPELIPDSYWSVQEAGGGELLFEGAVLIRVKGYATPDREALSAELALALDEPSPNPFAEAFHALKEDGVFRPAMLVAALAIGGIGAVAQGLLFRALVWSASLAQTGTRTFGLAEIAVALLGLTLLAAIDWQTQAGLFGLARRFETRLRWRFLHKLPLIDDRYFQSRLISDMAQRVHNAHLIRQAPLVAGQFLRAAFGMLATLVCLVWYFPATAWISVAATALGLIVPLLAQRVLASRDLRQRELSGALNRHYLEALTGVAALRAHGGETAMRRVQQKHLDVWTVAGNRLIRAVSVTEALNQFIAAACAVGAVYWGMQSGVSGSWLLLLIFWSLMLVRFARETATATWQYPALRNSLLRLLEPLGAPEESAPPLVVEPQVEHGAGVAIQMKGVRVVAGGNSVLEQIDLDIQPGERVAIVGSSGAGKSTLASLLLGWHKPAAGTLLVDGEQLQGGMLAKLRAQTAWVDPQVQIWNATLRDNLRFGAESDRSDASLMPETEQIAARLPDGLDTVLGEGGALVAGGFGMQVRFERARLRKDARLVILDEAGRGLDRARRQEMVAAAREHWPDATMLVITHDVSETLEFERVLVVEDGRIVEDGVPRQLRAASGSRYRALCDAEWILRRDTWQAKDWRRVQLDDGELGGEAMQ